MKFIGRKLERELLEREYRSSRGALVPIYGRRRVGKTRLIVEFVRHKPTLFFTATQSAAKHNLAAFAKQAADLTGLNSLAAADRWDIVLRDTIHAWKAAQRRVLVFDEVQWLAQSTPEFPSLLQQLWDHDWQHRQDLMVILCGSHFGFFRQQILGAHSPLYGRRTGHIHLRPFDLNEAAAFHPRLGEVECAQVYFITGGVPYYLQKFAANEALPTGIIRNFLAPHADLATEADFLLHEEIKQVPTAKTILSAIATGAQRFGEIATAVGVPPSNLPYYLDPLEHIGFIEKRTPLSRQTKSPRKSSRYAIADPFLRFWFRFMFEPFGPAVYDNSEAVFQDRLRPYLDAYWGSCWERVCRLQLPKLYAKEKLTCAAEIGEYWNSVQIDVVSLRGDRRTDLGECRWSHVQSLNALARELEQKIPSFPNPTGDTLERRLFVKSFAGKTPEHCRVHTLKDLMQLGV